MRDEPMLYELRRPDGVVVYQVMATTRTGPPAVYFDDVNRPTGPLECWLKIGEGDFELQWRGEW